MPRLRVAIADHLTASGLATTPEQILVTSGAQQAVSLVFQLIVGPRDTVVFEELTHPGAMDAARAQQARLVAAPLGPHGVDLPGLERVIAAHQPRLTYLIPSVHNPTGRSLPGPARARLAEMATTWSTTIVDDRTLADTQVDGTAPPPLAAYADHTTARRILTIGSLSKSMWGGLRVGWVRVQPELVHRLARLRTVSDLGSPVHPQLIAASLLEAAPGILPLRRRRLRARIDLGDRTAEEVCSAAMSQGVGLVPGAVFAPGPDTGGRHRLRLPIGHPPELLREAVSRIATAWNRLKHAST